jgi:hypothetical protein
MLRAFPAARRGQTRLAADEADDQDQHEQREDEEDVPAGEHARILTYADNGI